MLSKMCLLAACVGIRRFWDGKVCDGVVMGMGVGMFGLVFDYNFWCVALLCCFALWLCSVPGGPAGGGDGRHVRGELEDGGKQPQVGHETYR